MDGIQWVWCKIASWDRWTDDVLWGIFHNIFYNPEEKQVIKRRRTWGIVSKSCYNFLPATEKYLTCIGNLSWLQMASATLTTIKGC